MISNRTAHVLGLTDATQWRDAAPAHHGGELVPYLRQLAEGIARDCGVRKEDTAYWQAAERIDELSDAVRLILPLAKGYRPENQTAAAKETCRSWIRTAEDALARARGEG